MGACGSTRVDCVRAACARVRAFAHLEVAVGLFRRTHKRCVFISSKWNENKANRNQKIERAHPKNNERYFAAYPLVFFQSDVEFAITQTKSQLKKWGVGRECNGRV